MAKTELRGEQIKDASVSLTADVTGTLPVANGGTGSATLTSNSALLGNGTGALQTVAPGTSGNVLRSNGTTWTSAASTPRVTSTASSATPTPDMSTTDQYNLTALAANATFGAPTGSPVDGQILRIRIKDNATVRTLAWNAAYRAIGVTLPTTTVASKTLYVAGYYNTADSTLDVLAVGQQA